MGRASYRIFPWGGNFFFIAGETMWLIDHSEGEGVGGGCAPSHAAHSAETYCLILFLTVRFTLWGMLLCLPLGQLLLKNLLGGGTFSG